MAKRNSFLPTPEQAAAARRMGLILSFQAPQILGSADGLLLPPAVARFVAAHFKSWTHAAEAGRFTAIGPFYRPEEVSFILIPYEFREDNGNVLLADPEHSIKGRFERLLVAFRTIANELRIDAMTPEHQREDRANNQDNLVIRPEALQPDLRAGNAVDVSTPGELQSQGAGSQLLMDLVDTLNRGREAMTFIPPPKCGPVELPPPGTVITRPKTKMHAAFDMTGIIHGLLKRGGLVAVDKWLVQCATRQAPEVIGTQFRGKVRPTGEKLSFPLYEVVEDEDDAGDSCKEDYRS